MSNRPANILFISDDQHRYDCLEMTGKFPVRTPNLARLAREGVWHRQAYSTCPLCMPARASLHNGLYAHQTGLNRNIGRWPPQYPSLPGVLRAAGYHTAAIGKLHVFEAVPEHLDLTTVREDVLALGYDDLFEVGGKALAYYADCEWTHHLRRKGLLDAYRADGLERDRGGDACVRPFALPSQDYADAFIGDHCVRWLEDYRDERPFFLWAGLCSPHPPYDAPAECLAAHRPEDQPPPVGISGTDYEIDCSLPAMSSLFRSLSPKSLHYAAMVEIVDRQVGRLLDVLDRRGWADKTLVVFVSDHGEMLGDHGLEGKCFPYDPSVRVPLLARWPGVIGPGIVSDALVEITDLPATCLEAATGEADATKCFPATPGQSLLGGWRAGGGPGREFAYSEDGGQFCPPFQMIRTGEWKYVFYTRDGREALFDMRRDADECRNLAGAAEHLAVQDHMRSRLLRHLANTPPPPTLADLPKQS